MKPTKQARPLSSSLSRFKSLFGIAAALGFATNAQVSADVQFQGNTGPTPGDGVSWLDARNWQDDLLPSPFDNLIFGTGITGPIQLGGAQTANSLTFNGSYTLGAYGTELTLNDQGGAVSVSSGSTATINAAYTSTSGLNLTGGGALFLNNPTPTFAGNILVDGAGTTLLHRQEGPTVQYNGVGSAQEFGRSDQVTLGLSTAVKTITLQNGGTYRIVGTGNNPEGNYKNVVIGTGGGTFDLAAGYIVHNVDDVGQITTTTEAFTKAGKGRLIITGNMADVNPLAGTVNINGGMLSLDRLQGGSTTAGTRFAGVAAGAFVNVNSGGILFMNNGTAGRLDVGLVNLNDGGTIAFNGNVTHVLGLDAGGTSLNVTGTGNILFRELFGPQNERLYRIRTDITGSGTIVAVPNTNSGGNPRMVIERNTSNEFTGIFRLPENMALEGNPRNMPTANIGKVIGQGDVDFAGWASRLDVRDSTANAVELDYKANDLLITSTQAGSVPRIAVLRGDTAAGTGHIFNFGLLSMGNQRLGVEGNNSHQVGISKTAIISGNSVIELRTDGTHMVFSDPTGAIREDAAGRKLTLVKTGPGNAAARDVIVGGPISLSNLEVSTGTLQLRGTTGAIGTAFGNAAPTIIVNGGANNFTNGLPTQGLLHLDSNTGHVVGPTTIIAAGQNLDRIADSATLEMRSNSILRLTSQLDSGTTELIGTTNVGGHATFDVVKTGTSLTPVALTLNSFNLTGQKATANFTGTSLGLAGTNTSRIVLNPTTASTGILGAQFHSGNEWAKYDTTVDNGFQLGVTPFVAADYTIDATATDAAWAAGQQLKLTSGTGTVLTANRNVARVNAQFTVANQAINLAGSSLTLDEGGLLVSGQLTGIVDGATGAAPSGTAGITSGNGTLYAHNNSQLDLRVPVTGAIDFVKSGTATLRLTHQSLAVGTGATAVNPFTAATWTSTLTGNWIINDGRLDVHRGQFLGGRPVILNGGHLEINEPVSNANADSIIFGWGNNITVNGNATVAADDNGESADANTGDRAAVLLGSLTINNGSTMSHGSFSDMDIAYMGGATFSGTPTLNAVRGGVNSATIINGALAGSGFNMVAYNGNSASVVLGGGPADNVANTYNGAITVLNGNLRLNKANGTTAITDGAATEDIIINGGALLWGPGQHGDLATTNNINVSNNGLVGIAATSPATIKTAGANQIADTANITLLTGTLGESDRITNEKFGNLVMKNGTLNVGLGTMEMDTATFSGGALGFDRGGTLKIGKATYLPGAFDQSVFTGLPTPGAYTTLEIGAGGISLTGQNITLGNGFSGNVAGSGGRLRLGGDLTFRGDDLIGGSYGRKGIFVQNGSSFRELGDSHIDLMGGTRDFGIDTDSIFTITAKITNGGLTKSGGGSLVLEPYLASTFTGPVTVNQGVLEAKGDGAFGTSAGGVTINSGGTVKLNSGWAYGDAFTVNGPGALIPGGLGIREVGALVAESGTVRLTGSVTIAGNATLAGNTFLDPSVAPGAGGVAYRIGTLRIEAAGGISGTGTVTLSGHGDGVVLNGVNTTSGGVLKDGAGTWSIRGASTYTGTTTVSAGTLLISHASALGAAAAGTTVLNGGTLAVSGGITLAEPLTINGAGVEGREGALDGVGGTNTVSSTVTLGSAASIRANEGAFDLTATSSVSGSNTDLTLAGSGNGNVRGAIAIGQGSLTKNGTGTWTLSGANTFLGATNVNGGVLALDFTANNSSKLSETADLIFGGGNLSVLGSSTAPTVQFVGGTFLTAGGANVSVTSSGAQAASVSLGTISRFIGGTVNFNLPANGAILTNSGATNGILGAHATVNNNDWATVSGSAITAFNGYTPLSTAGIADNAILAASTVTDANSVNSLKITGGAGVTGVATGMTLQSGGLLYTGSGIAGIAGTGTLAGATSADEFIVHTASGTLDIATSIIGSGGGSLTKDGPGKLVLSGTNGFSGAININDGTLSIVGPGGTTHPNALGTSAGPRNLNINGGTFEVVGGDYDSGATNMYYVIGSGGATIRSTLGAIVTINDSTGPAPAQLSGSGDLTFTGGGRYQLSGGAPNFPNFTGKVTVDGGILNVGNGGATGFNPVGTGQNQTITLKPGSTIINQANFALGQNGLVNNIVAEGGGVEFFAQGGNRVYSGDIRLGGTNSIVLFERDTPSQERQVYFNGRVSGTGVTLNVYGANFGNPFYLASGSNQLTGTINLNDNAVLETRMPGSLGLQDGDLTVNLSGTNSRLFLRHFQNGDFHANVNVNATSEINSARLVNYGGGTSQLLSINNLTSNTDGILTFGGSDAYSTHVAGTAILTANTILNATSGNLLLDNGLTFSGAANKLEKRGGASVILHGPANNTGPTIVHQGFLILQNGGTLANTSGIELRGGELRVENSTVVNGNRLNDAAPITLGGGVLRLTGAETIGTVTAVAGTTQIVNNPTSDTVPTALTLTGFTREVGSVVQFQNADFGAATGSGTLGQGRVSSRILIPGQANTTQTIPGFLGNNSLDFIQYDGTTIDNGVALGARDMRNPGSGAAFPTNYSDNAAETGWNDNIILRSTNATDNTVATITLTAARALDAIKIEAGGTNRDITYNLGGFGLRIEGGGILDVSATTHDTIITNGTLTAGPATPGVGTAELFLGGTNASTTIDAVIANNGSQAVAVVKTGTGTVTLNGANTYTGGLYITQGTLNTTTANGLGTTPQNITLAGGTLQFNIADAGTIGDLGVQDHNITVRSNSLLILDNGALAGTDNKISLGSVTIPGPYTFGMRGFDAMDGSFTGTHTFAGVPTLDMAQTGGNQTSVFTFNGPITGSGFYVTSSGNVNDATSVLQIGGAEASPNTYTGKVTVLLPNSNGEDLRVELNKADNVTAITGDLEIQGGTVRNLANEQIANSSNLTITQGQYDANGKSETIASVTLRGGEFRTNSSGGAGTPVITVTGDFNATGVDNTTGAGDGIGVNQNSTLIIGGMLRMNGYSRAVLGPTAANLVITGGLEMTGTTLQQSSGAGANITRLLGDVTTFASSNVARLGNSTDSDTFTELAGDRTFNIADGSAGLDFSLSSVVRNSSSPALPGGIIKTGPGVMQIEGGGTSNSYTGATVVNQGTLVLFKSVGVNAVPAGPLTVGDGVGGARADQVIIRNSNQIADATEVTIASSGLLDLETFNTSETIASLSGGGNVDLGPGSVLTVNGGTTTVYTGSIRGAGSLAKAGTGVLALTGTNDIVGGTALTGGGLIVNGSLSGAVTAATGTTLGGDGAIVGPVTVDSGATLAADTLATGSLVLNGTFSADVLSKTNYDSINVTGDVVLGGTLSLNIGAGPFGPGDAFALIINNGSDSVIGEFAGLPEGSTFTINGLQFSITYAGNADGGAVGNDVILAVPEPGSAALLLGGLAMLAGRRRRRES